MKLQKLGIAFILLLGTILLQSCGGGAGSNTNGTLSMAPLTATDQTGGFFQVEGSATFTPPAGKVANGAQINIVAQFNTASGAPTIRTSTVTLDSTGVASFFYPVQQTTEPIFVSVSASIGDLHQTKSITVPAISPLSVTPSVLAFANTDAAGASKSLTITGGVSPFTVASSVPTDISVAPNGSSITVALVKTPTGIQKSATITVRDQLGNAVDVPVTYF